ncbi:MAG: GntR family transcriptional regulator [Planctomycetaceae bacterium]|nr:GntR family transcriptional regulator [Planctomycetaceae bacterium]
MHYSKWNNVTEHVFENIKTRLMEGEFPLNSKLPSEKMLCEAYNVGRSSVREALSMLEALGMIRIERGRGSFVESIQENTTKAKTWYQSKTDSLAELIDTRCCLECLAAEKAAVIITDDQIATMENLNARFLESAKPTDVAHLLHYDTQFHRLIFQVCNIGLLAQLNEVVESAYAEYRANAYILTQHIDIAAQGHSQIIAAMRAHNQQLAKAVVEIHIRQSLEHITKILETGK